MVLVEKGTETRVTIINPRKSKSGTRKTPRRTEGTETRHDI
jgi:hypothetical protein